MKDFHCDMLELRFPFKSEEADEAAFLEAAKIKNKEEEVDEDGDLGMGFTFDSREEAIDYHAHMQIWFLKVGGGNVIIKYHNSPAEPGEDDPDLPHVEDFMPWLARFFRVDKFTANVNATYLYNNAFSPTISLPFPLIATDKALAGCLVTGLSILLPTEQAPVMTIIQKAGDDTYCALTTTSEISLGDFNLLSQLKQLSATVNRLVKKQETTNEKSDTQKDNK